MAKFTVDESSLSAVAAAIRTKGGTSAELKFPDGFTSAIGAIQSEGGGLPDGVSALASGSYTPASDLMSANISHGLGAVPSFVVFAIDEAEDYGSYVRAFAIINIPSRDYEFTIATFYRDGTSESYQISSSDGAATSTTFRAAGVILYGIPLKGGATYHWVAGIIDGV